VTVALVSARACEWSGNRIAERHSLAAQNPLKLKMSCLAPKHMSSGVVNSRPITVTCLPLTASSFVYNTIDVNRVMLMQHVAWVLLNSEVAGTCFSCQLAASQLVQQLLIQAKFRMPVCSLGLVVWVGPMYHELDGVPASPWERSNFLEGRMARGMVQCTI